MRRSPRVIRIVGLLSALALAGGCTSAVSGHSVVTGAASSGAIASSGSAVISGSLASGSGSVTGPNGPKANVPPADLTVSGDGHTKWDTQAKNAIADLYTYYKSIFPTDFDKDFKAATALVSYDSNDKNAKACGSTLYQFPNAGYVYSCDTIIWDRGVELPTLGEKIGDLAVPTVLAHEMGHLVQNRLGVPQTSPTIMLEQQADCYAGAYWKWVAEGHSKYYNINTGVGIRQALQTLAAVRDSVGSTPDATGAHGNAFDRAYAETEGFTQGATRCNKIDMAELNARISESGFTAVPNDFGNIPVSPDYLQVVQQVVEEFFGQQLKGYTKPKLQTFEGTTGPSCDGKPTSFPVGYCKSTNTVTYNLVELVRIGSPTDGFDSTSGDFSALILLVSRMALADGTEATGDAAGLRALCASGAWASWMKKPQGPKRLSLSPVDLDNAEYEVMASPLPAADATGKTSTQVVEQLQAFNTGVVSGLTACLSAYK